MQPQWLWSRNMSFLVESALMSALDWWRSQSAGWMSSLRSGCCSLWNMTASGDTSTTGAGSVYLRGVDVGGVGRRRKSGTEWKRGEWIQWQLDMYYVSENSHRENIVSVSECPSWKIISYFILRRTTKDCSHGSQMMRKPYAIDEISWWQIDGLFLPFAYHFTISILVWGEKGGFKPKLPLH